jgi:threonine aldolase
LVEALSARTKLISTKQAQPPPLPVRADGTIPIEELQAAVKDDDPHFAITRLVTIENMFAGRVVPRQHLAEVAEFARERKLATHLDVDRAAVEDAIGAVREIAERRR